MADFRTATPELEAEYMAWLDTRPKMIRDIGRRFRPWKFYRLHGDGGRPLQRCVILSFCEPEDASGCVTLRVGIAPEFNPDIPFVLDALLPRREVFGVKPNDLVECDLPEGWDPEAWDLIERHGEAP